MQPGQEGANPYAPQQPIVTGQMGIPVVGQFFPPTSALAALILACLSFVLCGVFMSIPALIMAGQALQITKNMPGHPDHGTAQAAQIVAWVNIGLTILVVILYAGMIGFFAMNGDL
jgi:hypothetical protein